MSAFVSWMWVCLLIATGAGKVDRVYTYKRQTTFVWVKKTHKKKYKQRRAFCENGNIEIIVSDL